MSAVISPVTNEEKAIWKSLYLLYEAYHDCKWTDSDWLRYTKEIGKVYEDNGRNELMCQMIIGLTEYFSGISKALRSDTDVRAEQLMLEV